MPLVINSNPLAQIVQNNLGKANKSQADAMRRLSSGLRINSAKDDPAGLAKSDRIQTEIRSQNKVVENLNQGVSYSQFADATLEEIGNLIQRGGELAVQAANSTLSNSDRQSLNEEFTQIKEQIDQLAKTSTMFGQLPLSSASSNPIPSIGNILEKDTGNWLDSALDPFTRIPKGSTNVQLFIGPMTYNGVDGPDIDFQIFTTDGKHLIGTDLNDITWATNGITSAVDLENLVFSSENGFTESATYDSSSLIAADHFGLVGTNYSGYNGMNFSYSGDADRVASSDGNNDGLTSSSEIYEKFTVDEATEDLLISVVGTGPFDIIPHWDNMPEELPMESSEPMKILANTKPTGESDYIDIQKTPADLAALGLESTVIDPAEEAEAALTKLAEALQITDNHRSYYGATMTSLEGRISATVASREANSATLSRILDADFSTEVSELTKADILQQAGASIMVQANSLPQISLELLKV